jgi:Ca-activated chloride channel family protein
MTVKLRYKEPEGKESRLLEVPVVDTGLSVRAASADFKFAASVAMFGMNLRSSKFRGDATLEYAQELASEGAGRDSGGYRADFQQLVKTAANLRRGAPTVEPTTP